MPITNFFSFFNCHPRDLEALHRRIYSAATLIMNLVANLSIDTHLIRDNSKMVIQTKRLGRVERPHRYTAKRRSPMTNFSNLNNFLVNICREPVLYSDQETPRRPSRRRVCQNLRLFWVWSRENSAQWGFQETRKETQNSLIERYWGDFSVSLSGWTYL